MNAIIRKKREAPAVLTNEAIEVHLTYLRSGVDAVQAALPVLRDKIDLLAATVDTKIESVTTTLGEKIEKTNDRIEAVNTSLGEKIQKTHDRIDAVNTSLGEKIEKTNERIEAVNTSLGEKIQKTHDRIDAVNTSLGGKIEKTADRLAEVHGYQKAIFWVFSIAGTIAAMVSIARTLDWI